MSLSGRVGALERATVENVASFDADAARERIARRLDQLAAVRDASAKRYRMTETETCALFADIRRDLRVKSESRPG